MGALMEDGQYGLVVDFVRETINAVWCMDLVTFEVFVTRWKCWKFELRSSVLCRGGSACRTSDMYWRYTLHVESNKKGKERKRKTNECEGERERCFRGCGKSDWMSLYSIVSLCQQLHEHS